jgi:hypothetical protein
VRVLRARCRSKRSFCTRSRAARLVPVSLRSPAFVVACLVVASLVTPVGLFFLFLLLFRLR